MLLTKKMKIYTKTGDKGTTCLPSGKRVRKDDLQVEAVGTLDELNAWLGMLSTSIKDEEMKGELRDIQTDLFTIGGTLRVDDGRTEQLEQAIDKAEETLPPIKGFVYPGGSSQAALCHVCRTVCRRAERRFISLSDEREVSAETLRYLNRLSDFLFQFARKLNILYNCSEKLW